ncbi:two-component system, OmpR family, osmolarity sensor histidine kinase EnvZ [Roseovarius pacificus]|uniref:histidine kinase n=1 Tax=Roseovarius pacificus TaxID=337701 RepID=A0A1M6X7M4_9RHOB|nr:ATP-binding protein [Roseovarius pacificus]GGO52464.1 two-component sensor histidine kinase [Roseovarius pacificus]SHL01944.1 two-component system, OmpR family, osmolarity sensor histidine kinase EnvZ [Roseovarius pacificus]
MSFRWLKSYTPRSLYGRAILILLLPVVSLFLVVAVVFTQRHFEGVTRQMTHAVSREVNLILDSGLSAEEVARSPMARILQIGVMPVPQAAEPRENLRRWYDFTGIIVIRELSGLLPELEVMELPNDHFVHLYMRQPDGLWRLTFDRKRVSAPNAHQMFVNMVFFGALMTVIAFLYLRNQLRPITRLARAAEAFGRGRHVPYRPAGAVEVRAAGHAFLDMRARIERQIEQRTLMLSGVSHDMRTPLTRLKLSLSMLEDEDRGPMEQDVADMERLLDEFLAFARGAQEGQAEPVDPADLVRRIVEDCQRANIAAELREVKGEGTVMLREGAIRRAVENLINNAVRYGSRAEVSVLLTNKTLRIRVEDDGPGIPPERREEATKPFARLEPARNQNKGTGVGLGLSIALDIARAHGGTLRLGESTRLGGLRADIVIAR